MDHDKISMAAGVGSIDEAAPSRTRSLTYVMAAFLVALPAMILVYLWATGG